MVWLFGCVLDEGAIARCISSHHIVSVLIVSCNSIYRFLWLWPIVVWLFSYFDGVPGWPGESQCKKKQKTLEKLGGFPWVVGGPLGLRLHDPGFPVAFLELRLTSLGRALLVNSTPFGHVPSGVCILM